MKKIFIAISICLVSCSQKRVIKYIYNEIVVTRIDEGGITYFYFGDCDGRSYPCPNNYIKGEYFGFDGNMGGYLIFHPENRVELIRMYGSFKEVGNSPNLQLSEFNDNYLLSNWIKSFQNNFNNKILISDLLREEKDINLKNNSRVKANYP